jgi:LuxR family transcriptional regulator, glucitol operon activator
MRKAVFDALETSSATYRLKTAIEQDVRQIIMSAVFVRDKQDDFMPSDVLTQAREKRIRKKELYPDDECPQMELLMKDLDWGDYPKILQSLIKGEKNQKESNEFIIAQTLLDLREPRSRNAHANLESDSLDLDILRKTCANIFLPMGAKMWRMVDQQLKVLTKEDNQTTTLKKKESRIAHNLPKEDYYQTGFIGRGQDVQNLRDRLQEGQSGVIQLTGEGGIGKTSLALKVANSFIDESKEEGTKPWDQIFYISFKLDALRGISGVQQIDEAIGDVWPEIYRKYIGLKEDLSEADQIKEIYNYLTTFRTLFVLDNCESIPKGERGKVALQRFIDNLPKTESRILITTRDPDFTAQTYSVSPFQEKQALALMYKYAEVTGCEEVKGAGKKAKEWVQALANNPLAIRWFVDCISGGKNSKDLLKKGGAEIQTLLDFLFGNVYEILDECEREVINVTRMAGISGRLSDVRVKVFLDQEFSYTDVSNAIEALVRRNILRREESKKGQELVINEIPKNYVAHKFGGDKEKSRKIQKRQQLIAGTIESERRKGRSSTFEKYQYKFGTDDEAYVAAVQIKKALDLNKEAGRPQNLDHKKIDQALKQLEEAEQLLPRFSEIHRVRALLLEQKGEDQYIVSEQYETASTCADSPRLMDSANYHHAEYLFSCERYDDALNWVGKVQSKDEFAPRLLTAEINVRAGYLKEAKKIFDDLVNKFYQDPELGKNNKMRLLANYAACYRAIADDRSREKDYSEALDAINTGLELLLQLKKDECLFGFGIGTLGKLVNDGLYISCSASNADAALNLAKLVYKSFSYPQQIERPIRIKAFQQVTTKLENSSEVIEFLERAEVEEAERARPDKEREKRHTGTVKMIQHGQRGDYGFIEMDSDEDEEPVSLYFDERGLVGQTKMEAIPRNCRVEFSILPTDKEKEAAVDIRVISY